jgi:hypothetical protein
LNGKVASPASFWSLARPSQTSVVPPLSRLILPSWASSRSRSTVRSSTSK